ncbi:uncharacterized protein [Rutidosis leptorrhynchoides]|uniref:uncharacterized protein n=1 Tax=Rutidosis leptorrhynchoides TaxID=125765 RepID=UPI003A991BFD
MNQMGKRKRRTDRNKTPPSPALTSHSSQRDSSFKEKSSHSRGSNGLKHASSSLSNIMERSSSSVHYQSSAHQRHHNVSRALFSRAPQHYYNVRHSQRNTADHAGPSTSHGKTALHDDKLQWKSGHKAESGFGYRAGKRDKASRKMDRIRSNPLIYHGPRKLDIIGADCPDFGNILCRLCQQVMREGPVLAVLVCGHIYHDDCLVKRTRDEDKSDPPCPLCVSSDVVN